MRGILIVIPKKKILPAVIIGVLITLSFSAALMVSSMPSRDILSGMTIVIDAGHGGVDGGAGSRYILEKDVNLDVALILRKKLSIGNASVVLTRSEDVELSKSKKINRNRYIEDLNARVDIINNSNAQIFVSIHTNTNPKKPSTRGMITFYSKCHPHNRDIAYLIQNTFNKSEFIYQGKSYTASHTPKCAEYYILSRARVPGIIVETGFISNSADTILLNTTVYREHIADIIYKGINEYFSLRDKLPLNIDYNAGIEEEDIEDTGEYTISP